MSRKYDVMDVMASQLSSFVQWKAGTIYIEVTALKHNMEKKCYISTNYSVQNVIEYSVKDKSICVVH